MSIAFSVALVTSVQLTAAEPRSPEEDESESKTPNAVVPFVSRTFFSWMSDDHGGSGDFSGPPPDEERTDKRRPSEVSNATRSSERPRIRVSSREKRIACVIIIKAGPKRENKRRPKDDVDDDEDLRQRERQRRRGSSQKVRSRNQQSNTEKYGKEVQQKSTKIPDSQGRGRSSPQESREGVSSSTLISTGPPPGEEEDLERRPSRTEGKKGIDIMIY